MEYLCISSHIFVSNFGKFFGKYKAFTKAKYVIGKRQFRNWEFPSYGTYSLFFQQCKSQHY